MLPIAAIVWAGILAAGCAILYATTDRLPARVASHFNFEGFANGYMLREDYLVLMLLLTIAVPVAIVALNFLLPRVAPRLIRIPARDYWMVAERRAATSASLTASGFVTASMVTGFMIGVHLLVTEANSRVPPRLETGAMWILIAALALGALTWQLLQRRRFRPAR